MCIISSLTLGAVVLYRAVSGPTMALKDLLFKKPHLVAIASGMLFPLTCALCYGLALYLGHLQPTITYISDTVTDPPLSGLFGLLLTFTLVLFSAIATMRYMLVRAVCKHHPQLGSPRVLLANSVAGWLAVVSVFCLLIVAHFQVHTATGIHALSALVGIGAGVLYFIGQSICTKAMVPLYTSPGVFYFRLVLTVLCVIFYMLGVVFGFLSLVQFRGTSLHRWLPEDGGYEAHAISSVSEWFIAVLYSTYFLSYAHEFKSLQLQRAKIIFPDESEKAKAKESAENGVQETATTV